MKASRQRLASPRARAALGAADGGGDFLDLEPFEPQGDDPLLRRRQGGERLVHHEPKEVAGRFPVREQGGERGPQLRRAPRIPPGGMMIGGFLADLVQGDHEQELPQFLAGRDDD